MFIQSDAIRDFVFPLCTTEVDAATGEWRFTRFLGSAFLIGSRSYALTAAHVVADVDEFTAMFVDKGEWLGFKAVIVERHPTEDVALIRIKCQNLKSIFCMNDQREYSSRSYMQFAYPDDMMYELMQDNRATGRPDLVYLEGYIRRRTNHAIPNINGTALFELSQIGGTGCSGSPIYKTTDLTQKWTVLGIYVAERLNERGTSVAYAVREDVFREWSPVELGRTIRDECEA